MSELSTTTSRLGSRGAQAAVDVGGEARVRARPRRPRCPSIARSAATCSGPLASSATTMRDHAARDRLADARHQRRHALGVAVAGDHDVDRLAVLRDTTPRRAGTGRGPSASAAPGDGAAGVKRSGKVSTRNSRRAPAEIVVGQIDAPAQARQRTSELAVERALGDRLGASDRWTSVSRVTLAICPRRAVVLAVLIVHLRSSCVDGNGSSCSGAKPARPSSESRRLAHEGSIPAREPSRAPSERATW